MKLLNDYDITSVSTSCIENCVVKLNNILKTAATVADAMGITAEHFVYAENSIIDSLCLILNKLLYSLIKQNFYL